LVVKAAVPSGFSGTLPSGVAPDMNSTVPVGLKLLGTGTVTVAVKVTFFPRNEAGGVTVRLVAVGICTTLQDTAGEVLPE
jgi:hypothetical protein